MRTDLAIHCGMPDERKRLEQVFHDVPIFAGTDKFKLPELVPQTCKRILNMGVCGGLAPPLKVGDTGIASKIVDKAGTAVDLDCAWADEIFMAAQNAHILISKVPWYSSGLLDEADTRAQRAAIYSKYPIHPQCIDDESRYTVALAQDRHIQCVIVRPLSDDWTETLPLEARGAIMNSDGSANVEHLLGTLQLMDIPQLIQIANDYTKSLDAISAVATAIKDAVLA